MKTATIDGRAIAWRESQGRGLPVLLLHGFPLSSAMWAAQFDALGERHRLIAPDLPGFGASPPPEDPARWRIEGYAGAVRGLLGHLGVERAVVCGLSMGGYVAFELWRQDPSLFEALFLVDTKAAGDSPEQRAGRVALQEEIRREGTAKVAERLADGLLGARSLADPERVEAVRALCRPHPREGFLAALEAMKERPDSTPILPTIDRPTWVVVGEEDRLTPPELARGMQVAIRAARLEVLSGAGHLSNFEEPRAFNEVLASSLDGLSGR